LVHPCGTLEIDFDEGWALIITAAPNDQRGYLGLGEGEEKEEESLDLPVEWEPVVFVM